MCVGGGGEWGVVGWGTLLARGALLTTVASTPPLKVTESSYKGEPGMPWVITSSAQQFSLISGTIRCTETAPAKSSSDSLRRVPVPASAQPPKRRSKSEGSSVPRLGSGTARTWAVSVRRGGNCLGLEPQLTQRTTWFGLSLRVGSPKRYFIAHFRGQRPPIFSTPH